MGLFLTANGANFEGADVSYFPPVEEGLLYWGFLNDSKDRLTKNYAPDGSPVLVVGSPAVDSRGAVLDDTNYVNTNLLQTPSFTLIVAGNPVTDGGEVGMFISNYSGGRPGGLAGTSFGVSLFCGFNDSVPGGYEVRASVARFSGESGSTSGLNYVALPNLDITKPAFMAMTFDGTEKVVRAYNLSTGASGARPKISDFTDVATTPFYIGACPNAAWDNQPKHLHFAAIYDRKLSEAELGLIYTRMKPYLALRGVGV